MAARYYLLTKGKLKEMLSHRIQNSEFLHQFLKITEIVQYNQ